MIRRTACVFLLGLGLLACDDKPAAGPGGAPSATASVAAPAPSHSAPPPVSAAKRQMPPRPVPIGSSGRIQPSAPPEDQMMAIQYTLGRVSRVNRSAGHMPTLDDIPKPATGADREGRRRRSRQGDEGIAIGRHGEGCTDRVLSNLIAQRAGSSLKAAFERAP
jgi:hypothetical protein